MNDGFELLRLAADTSPRLTILFNSSFKVEYCNTASYEFFGLKPNEDLSGKFSEYINAHMPEIQSNGQPSVCVKERFSTAMKEGQIKFDAELIIKGVVRFFDVEMKKFEFGNDFNIVVFISDITETRERERELMRIKEQNDLQLEKFNLVVKAAKIGLWEMEVVKEDTTNLENPFIWSNEARRMLGFTDENDFPNKMRSLHERIHPDEREKIREAFGRHVTDKTGMTPYNAEYRVKKKNGEYGYFHATGETFRDEQGNPIRVAGAFVDITETKTLILEIEKQRYEAERASKWKSDFLRTMSHEIRTPMNAILGITEILLLNENLNKNVTEALEKIHSSGDLLLGIINDILDLSKIEVGKLELNASQYALASLINDVAMLNMMNIGSKEIKFKLSVDNNLPAYLLGDELRLKQIFNNLLSNAIKYTDKGTIKLSFSTELKADGENETLLVVRVSDTGHGMSKEQVVTLFDEYVRFDTSSTRATEGTGLGMSITKNLISIMNGTITVDSEPGKGSEFTVRLPQKLSGTEILGKEMAENLCRFRTANRTQMKRVRITREAMPYGSVLLVDDVETNIYVAKGLLTPYNLKIDTANSGFEAIEKIEAGNVYDIIFMDHMMPKMDGIEATKIIRNQGYTQPIVALTANAVSGQAEIFLSNGFDDFISKPIDIRQLNIVLNKQIRDKQPIEVLEAVRDEAAVSEVDLSNSSSSYIDSGFTQAFLRDADKILTQLEAIAAGGDYANENDMQTYIVNVHGLKSPLTNLGKTDLSQIAEELEHAGRRGKIEMIKEKTPDFIKSLRSFTKELTPEKDLVVCEKIVEDTELLREMLYKIKNACEMYDVSTADYALAELMKKTWSPSTNILLDKISEHLLCSDFDEAAEIASIFSVV